MKERQYKAFSLNTHKKNWRLNRPSVCEFELTFGCNLHCKHCYTDCYNEPASLKNELTTDQVKCILDKVNQAGVIWLCFTGGDPLARKDFVNIYSYAKGKGFVISIFTNGCSINKDMIDCFKKKPPFLIEVTLNAVTEGLYEKITQTKGSFSRAMKGIDLILHAKLPLKIKTQVTTDNLEEFERIREFAEKLGAEFSCDPDLHARLNRDSAPCGLRIQPKEVLRLYGEDIRLDPDCRLNQKNEDLQRKTKNRRQKTKLFRCAVSGGDGIKIDPYGNIFLCNLIREPSFNLFEVDIEDARSKLLSMAEERKFTADSDCDGCNLKEACPWCPGRAYVETGDMEASIRYYCELAELSKRVESKQNAY